MLSDEVLQMSKTLFDEHGMLLEDEDGRMWDMGGEYSSHCLSFDRLLILCDLVG